MPFLLKKRKTLLLCLIFAFPLSAFSLTVTPDISSLSCNENPVIFTFDCAFTGSVLITTNAGTGISFPSYPPGAQIGTVTNGTITVGVEVNSTAPSNFQITFVILNSDLPCAVSSSSVSASMSHACILPVNDDCGGAIPLNVNIGSCSFTAYTTDNATFSGNTPSCGGSGYNDLWYNFEAINDTIKLNFDDFPGNVGYYSLYQNGCPNSGGSSIACSIVLPISGQDNILFTGLTLNNTYTLQLLHLPNTSGTDQDICLESTPLPCPLSIEISDGGANPPNSSYTSCDYIFTTGSAIINTSGNIYEAKRILLSPGFHSGTGVFEAKAIN